MRKKIVAGNWKMNKDFQKAKTLLNELKAADDGDTSVEKIVIPPFIYISEASSLLHNSSFKIGAQNCHHEKSGAFTGEISAEMLQSIACKYVLVGHSERRQYNYEDAALLKKKTIAALKAEITPIFCVGESLEERKGNQHFEIIGNQIKDALFSLEKEDFDKLILAYEPVWAIGTGETASPEQAQEMHEFIRNIIREKYGKETASKTRILYGGSCKPSNAGELFSKEDVDGGLIGGASLNPEDFLAIISAAQV